MIQLSHDVVFWEHCIVCFDQQTNQNISKKMRFIPIAADAKRKKKEKKDEEEKKGKKRED